MQWCRKLAALPLVSILILAQGGCSNEPEGGTARTKDGDQIGARTQEEPFHDIGRVTVTLRNNSDDEFMARVSEVDSTINVDGITEYAEARLKKALSQAHLPYSIAATLEFSIGIEGEMLKDPIKDPEGNLLNVGGTAVLPYPNVDADFVVSRNGDPTTTDFTAGFIGGNINGSGDGDGIKRVVDMSIGHLLKEFAKRGVETRRIVDVLSEGNWIPRAPYAHFEVHFGKIRIHQDGNLWEALSEIGSATTLPLNKASESDDPEISEEAKAMLARLEP